MSDRALSARLEDAEEIIRAQNRLISAMYGHNSAELWPTDAKTLAQQYENRYGVDLSGRLPLTDRTIVRVAHDLASEDECADDTTLLLVLEVATGKGTEACQSAIAQAMSDGYLSCDTNPDMPWPTSLGLELLHNTGY